MSYISENISNADALRLFGAELPAGWALWQALDDIRQQTEYEKE